MTAFKTHLKFEDLIELKCFIKLILYYRNYLIITTGLEPILSILYFFFQSAAIRYKVSVWLWLYIQFHSNQIICNANTNSNTNLIFPGIAGDLITIVGTGFNLGVLKVKFGGVECTGVVVEFGTQAQCTLGGGTGGSAGVYVSSLGHYSVLRIGLNAYSN